MVKKASLIAIALVVVCMVVVPVHAFDAVPDTADRLSFAVAYRWLYYNVNLDNIYSSSLSPQGDELNGSAVSDYTEVQCGIIFQDAYSSPPSYWLSSLTTYYLEFFVTADSGTEIYEFDVPLGEWKVIPSDEVNQVFGEWSNDLVTVDNPALFGVNLKDICRNSQVAYTNITTNTIRVRVAFQTMDGVTDEQYSAFLMHPESKTVGLTHWVLSAFHMWTDPNGNIFDVVVESALDNIADTVGNINNGIGAINDKLDSLLDEEKNIAQDQADASKDELLAQMDMFNVDTTADACKVLYNAFTYDGTQSYFYLPATGPVPFLGRQLWDEQFIDITPDYIMDDERLEPLFTCVRFVLYLACAYRIVTVMIALVRLFSGDGDAGETEDVD